MDRGNHDDGNFRVVTAEPIEQLEAVHFRHDQIEQDEVRRLLANRFLSDPPIAKSGAMIAAGFQHR